MGDHYVLTLQPTFTQGLILGQLSILVLLALILKYLFLDSSEYPFESSTFHPRLDTEPAVSKQRAFAKDPEQEEVREAGAESAEWLNLLLQQVAQTYRSKLRDDLSGAEGDEIARKRIEDYANLIRPPGFLDYIRVHAVDLGVSAPRISNAQSAVEKVAGAIPEIEFDLTYTDTISISLSTSYLFNYPMSSFARLPVSLTISLSRFNSSVTAIPPSPTSPAPVITITIPPTFTLDLKTTSLMGSRAKLANVPKLHELIQHQVRRTLAARGTWRIVLPGLSNIAQAQEEVRKELAQDSGFA